MPINSKNLVIISLIVTMVIMTAFIITEHSHSVIMTMKDGTIRSYVFLTESKAKEFYLNLSGQNDYKSIETTADVSLEESQYARLQHQVSKWCNNNPERNFVHYEQDVDGKTDVPSIYLACWHDDSKKVEPEKLNIVADDYLMQTYSGSDIILDWTIDEISNKKVPIHNIEFLIYNSTSSIDFTQSAYMLFHTNGGMITAMDLTNSTKEDKIVINEYFDPREPELPTKISLRLKIKDIDNFKQFQVQPIVYYKTSDDYYRFTCYSLDHICYGDYTKPIRVNVYPNQESKQ